jgi:hypothetical protein
MAVRSRSKIWTCITPCTKGNIFKYMPKQYRESIQDVASWPEYMALLTWKPFLIRATAKTSPPIPAPAMRTLSGLFSSCAVEAIVLSLVDTAAHRHVDLLISAARLNPVTELGGTAKEGDTEPLIDTT